VAYTALSTLAQNNLANAKLAKQFAAEQKLDTAKMDPFDG
jgi:hypothetical protein